MLFKSSLIVSGIVISFTLNAITDTGTQLRYCRFDSRPLRLGEYHNKANQVHFFSFPSTYKHYFYTILESINCTILL